MAEWLLLQSHFLLFVLHNCLVGVVECEMASVWKEKIVKHRQSTNGSALLQPGTCSIATWGCMCAPWLPWSDDAIIWPTNEHSLFELQKVGLVGCVGSRAIGRRSEEGSGFLEPTVQWLFGSSTCSWKPNLVYFLHLQALQLTFRSLVEAREKEAELEVQVQVMRIWRNINHITSLFTFLPSVTHLSNSWQQKLRTGPAQCKIFCTLNKTRHCH